VTAAKKDILQGWKDIAAYVSRDVRTVKRWEKQRGLPVRRMPGDGRANVYALIPDLDRWLSAGGSVEAEAEAELLPSAAAPTIDVNETFAPAEPPLSPQPHTSQQTVKSQHHWLVAAVAIVCLGALATVLTVRAHRHEQTVVDVPPFSPTQTAHTVKYSSRQPGVDALYLRGIYFYEQRTPDTLDRALKCFQQAVDKDPGYAPAYAGLAQTYNLIREYSMMPEAEAYTKAKAAAQHAIALDPKLSEAHASLGFVEFFFDWKPAEAEREFHTAIALDPNSALAHHWYGSMLTHEARFTESIAQLDLAQRLQPTSTSILSDHAFALGLSGHRNEAADMLQEVLNDDPDSPAPYGILSTLSLVEPRDIPRYLYEGRRFATLRHDDAGLKKLEEIEQAFRSGGAPALWRALLAEEERAHPSPNDRTYSMAAAEAVLGQRDASLHDLAQLAARRDPSLIGILIDPLMSSERDDPRFASIVSSVGFPLPH
jgi:tetratricopeptide (TPR) repeat protein